LFSLVRKDSGILGCGTVSVEVFRRFVGSKSLRNVWHCLAVADEGMIDLLFPRDAALIPDETSAAPDVRNLSG